jgi:transposase-like protein
MKLKCPKCGNIHIIDISVEYKKAYVNAFKCEKCETVFQYFPSRRYNVIEENKDTVLIL